ncbi:hypothetical protein HJ590_17775 [Naumannella sp. ID2617S]|nr:hypothetical protein [Naumannella sp. ID2617S]
MSGERSLAGIWQPVLVLVVGLVLVGYGLSIDPGRPTCGSTAMSPGQICETTSKGVPRKQNYDELSAEAQKSRLWFPIGGGVVALAGIGWGVLMLVRRGRPASAKKKPADSATASPQPSAGPAPAGGSTAVSSGQWVRRSGGHPTGHPQPQHPYPPQPPHPAQQPPAPWPHSQASAPWPQSQASAPWPPHQPQGYPHQQPPPQPQGPPPQAPPQAYPQQAPPHHPQHQAYPQQPPPPAQAYPQPPHIWPPQPAPPRAASPRQPLSGPTPPRHR